MNNFEKIIEFLKSNNLRITKARVVVVKVLIENGQVPMSPEEIYRNTRKLKLYDCNQSSVYRTLTTFEKIGLVKRNIFQGDASRYALIQFNQNIRHQHEHYFKCINCNIIEPFQGCSFSQKEKEFKRNGYSLINHHLEVTGLCPNCT